jgi:hypothetical protein
MDEAMPSIHTDREEARPLEQTSSRRLGALTLRLAFLFSAGTRGGATRRASARLRSRRPGARRARPSEASKKARAKHIKSTPDAQERIRGAATYQRSLPQEQQAGDGSMLPHLARPFVSGAFHQPFLTVSSQIARKPNAARSMWVQVRFATRSENSAMRSSSSGRSKSSGAT